MARATSPWSSPRFRRSTENGQPGFERGRVLHTSLPQLRISDRTPVPEFVAEFERKLDSKRGLALDVRCFLNYSFDADGSYQNIINF